MLGIIMWMYGLISMCIYNFIHIYIYKGRFSSGLSLGIGPPKKYLAFYSMNLEHEI